MTTNIDYPTLIGFVLFGLSELLGILPIPANGLLHSLFVGMKNSFSNPLNNTKLIQTVIDKEPDLENILSKISSNPNLITSIKTMSDNQHVLPLLEMICNNQDLEYLLTLIKNNPSLLTSIISQCKINPTIQLLQPMSSSPQLIQPLTNIQIEPSTPTTSPSLQ